MCAADDFANVRSIVEKAIAATNVVLVDALESKIRPVEIAFLPGGIDQVAPGIIEFLTDIAATKCTYQVTRSEANPRATIVYVWVGFD